MILNRDGLEDMDIYITIYNMVAYFFFFLLIINIITIYEELYFKISSF